MCVPACVPAKFHSAFLLPPSKERPPAVCIDGDFGEKHEEDRGIDCFLGLKFIIDRYGDEEREELLSDSPAVVLVESHVLSFSNDGNPAISAISNVDVVPCSPEILSEVFFA